MSLAARLERLISRAVASKFFRGDGFAVTDFPGWQRGDPEIFREFMTLARVTGL
jgi:hypothetical protein